MESLRKAWLARDWDGSLWIYSEKPYKKQISFKS